MGSPIVTTAGCCTTSPDSRHRLGTGKAEQAHSIDEFIAVEDYLQAVYLYANLLISWCGIEE